MGAYGEQCADTDGMSRYMVADGHEALTGDLRVTGLVDLIDPRIAALEAKLEATMADMRSLQRQNEHWQAECSRLSVLLVETQTQLAQRMALPANALRHGR